MSEDSRLPEDLEDISRRQFLMGAGGALTAVGAAKAAHNTILGYGELGMGTNLKKQDLAAAVSANMRTVYGENIGSARLRVIDDGVELRADDERYVLDFESATRGDAEDLDSRYGLGGRLTELFVDTRDFEAGNYTFGFSQPSAFFERVTGAETRPDMVAAVRRRRDRTVDPDIVETFTGTDPAETQALVEGLMAGFREHGHYDVPRYIAGSIEDNVIFGAADLRAAFEDPVDFESLLEADSTGLFCWELVYRSMEGFQAIAPWNQTIPLAAGYVRDTRHKHAFTALLTAIREDGELRLPMTFVDYTYSTLYHDLNITGLRGEGIKAYDADHRADAVYW
ncbi:hypothetical protein HWV23_04215 [Natronomonas halophila]|uniref:hypothetical protein n=1 Tax=Natronomonas halophila TaxID=2747817 RepID=UPI0015B3FD6E|nr:hypothetical protein [Natronomonas halophila]QLD84956.1 hypothetical protein HWV23_04215 [Natronomonas halophila]